MKHSVRHTLFKIFLELIRKLPLPTYLQCYVLRLQWVPGHLRWQSGPGFEVKGRKELYLYSPLCAFMAGYSVNLNFIYLFISSVFIACLQIKLTRLVSFLLPLFLSFFSTFFFPLYLFFLYLPLLYFLQFLVHSLSYFPYFFCSSLHGNRQKDEWNVAIHAFSTSKFALRKPRSNSEPEKRCFLLV